MCFLLAGFNKSMEIAQSRALDVNIAEETKLFIDDLSSQLEDQLAARAQIESQIAATADTPENQTVLQPLVERQAITNDQIDMLQTALDKEIYINSYDNTYLTGILTGLPALKAEIRALEAAEAQSPNAAQEDLLLIKRQRVSDYQATLDSKDFKEYVRIESDSINIDDTLSTSKKDIQIEYYSLWYKLDPTGMNQARDAAQSVTNMKLSLLDKIDYTSMSQGMAPMTPSQISDMENRLAVAEYRIQNNYLNLSDSASFNWMAQDYVFGFGIFIIALMMLVLAGGAVSQEISSGSIKSLIIAPVKRWKIFTAKLLSLLSVGLLALAVLYIFGMLALGLFFGFSNTPYVFASHGVAASFPFAFYQILSLLVSYIDIIVFIAFAFMLSILTRNTAAAVGISISTYFGSSIVMEKMMALPSYEWLRFIPFANMNLNGRVFPFTGMMQSTDLNSGFMSAAVSNEPGLIFSLAYLAVLLFCMTYTALDSFNRRDLK
jgi:ABC-type transport system involved in multi-copper enzyme maturation permease subunit